MLRRRSLWAGFMPRFDRKTRRIVIFAFPANLNCFRLISRMNREAGINFRLSKHTSKHYIKQTQLLHHGMAVAQASACAC